jgi:NADPH:quinone reductase-like Zn-dependent oxidoreductase
MKAIQIHTFEGPEAVFVYEDVARPTPGPGEVLIRVHAAGVNAGSWKPRTGHVLDYHLPLPLIPGWDISGEVSEVGPGVTTWHEGDAIYGLVRFPSPTGGAYAEYTTAPEAHLAPKPTTIDYLQAAGVPMAALTAWQALFDLAHLEVGQTVLVNGAAGGVGHFAVQLAKLKGARVIAVASGRHEAFLRELGADAFIDYTTTPVEQAAHSVDLVLDIVGGTSGDYLLSVLRRGGALIPITPNQYSTGRATEAGVTLLTTESALMRVRSNGVQLAEISHLIDAGQLHVAIDTVVPLSEAHNAHERGRAGHVRGKIVLRVAE